MTDTRDAWAAVGDRLSALGLKLKLHAEEELSDDDVTEKSGFERIEAVVSETFDALEDAYEDEAVREDVREAGRAFIEALETTVRNLPLPLPKD